MLSIANTDTWYILPISKIEGRPDILLMPNHRRSRYAKFEEAWHLLKR